jgi:hypothetical protein
MAFVVEDGTGTVPTANSYASVAEFKAYWDDRDFNYTGFSDTLIQHALIKATQYIEWRFRHRFRGIRSVYSPTPQPLSFPRLCLWVFCVLVTGVPDGVKQATSEYAKRVLTTNPDLQPDPGGYDATGQLIGITIVKVGPIEKHTTYEAGTGPVVREYPYADGLLADFIYCADGVVRA